MDVYYDFPNLSAKINNSAIALGTFDGIHIGHQKIIHRMVQLAHTNDAKSIVFTFSNHPLATIKPEQCPFQITSLEEKAVIIKSLGVDILISIPFTKEFLSLTPIQFTKLLSEKLRPKIIVVGENFTYGFKSAGNADTLQHDGSRLGFAVKIIPTIHVNNLPASSTLIRKFILNGNIRQANEILGRNFSITSNVERGDGRGRTLGYPTANIALLDLQLFPANGVYAVDVFVKNQHFYGIANIGTNPTFKGTINRLEVHILNFSSDLYNHMITVAFLAKIRDEITFANSDQLITQITADIVTAQQYFIVSS